MSNPNVPDSSDKFTTVEGWHSADDGEKLYTKTWKPTSTPKARLVFVHGFSEHCNTYSMMFPDIAAAGIEVFAFDQRGWGRSVKRPAQKGLTGPTSQVLADITSVLTYAQTLTPSLPLFLMGHSMGGAEIMHYAAVGPAATVSKIRGFLSYSPFVGLHPRSKPWRITVLGGRLMAQIAPNAQMIQRLDKTLLSHDQSEGDRFEADPLCHDTGTFGGFAGMLDRADQLDKVQVRVGKDRGVKSFYVAHGTGELICDYYATKRWCEEGGLEGVQDKTFTSYEGGYHRLHAEPNGEGQRFTKEVADWILERSGPE